MIYNRNIAPDAAIDGTKILSQTVTGNVYYVAATSDPVYSFWQSRVPQSKLLSTLTLANSAVTTNANDWVIFSGNSAHNIATMETISKNRVHWYGADGGNRLLLQGSRILLSTLGADAAATLTVTGVRNTFENLKVENSGTHANSVAAAVFSGEGTVWKNCSFNKLSDLDQTGVQDVIMREDSGTFLDCMFGFDTLVQTAARPTMNVLASGDYKMKDVFMRGCTFLSANTANTKRHFSIANTSSLLFTNILEDCNFWFSINATQAAITSSIAVVSVASLVEGHVVFVRPNTNATDFATAAANANFKIVAPASVTAAVEGIAPTA